MGDYVHGFNRMRSEMHTTTCHIGVALHLIKYLKLRPTDKRLSLEFVSIDCFLLIVSIFIVSNRTCGNRTNFIYRPRSSLIIIWNIIYDRSCFFMVFCLSPHFIFMVAARRFELIQNDSFFLREICSGRMR